MNDEHIAALTGIDLNLLLVLDALLTTGGATRAAKQLGITQSAVSHALRRLRQALSDPLLVRTPRGLVPTPRAQALGPTLSRLLKELHNALQGNPAFDSTTVQCSYTLAMTDYVSLLLMPPLMARLAIEAPGVEILIRPIEADETLALERGEVDLHIGRLFPNRQGFYQQKLFADRLLCMVAKSHKPQRKLTLAEYLRRRHLLISPHGQGPGLVDVALAEQGLSRRIALRVPYFMTAPLIVARTDFVLTLPERVAKALMPMLPVRLLRPPVELGGFSLVQAWHERHHQSPRHLWLRNLVHEVGRTL